jgi:peptide deformylase
LNPAGASPRKRRRAAECKTMVLKIVKYGHPVLRERGARVESLTPEIRELAANMLDTMHASKGVGLAAQQVGRAVQLAVHDVRGIKDRPSTLELDGRPAELDAFMPLVLINPEITPLGEPVAGPEGCLSFPEIFADITRPQTIAVSAMNLAGETLRFRCGGLLARAIQHEHDHLRGILFIDRMTRATKQELQAELDALQAETKAELKRRAR